MSGSGSVAAMLTMSGALIGFTSSLFVPHRYAASAELAFIGTPGVTHESYLSDARKLLESSRDVTLLPQSLELMIRRGHLFRERLYLEAFPELRDDVGRNLSIGHISLPGGLTGARIEFEDDDADTALDLVREVVSLMGDNAATAAGVKKASDVVRIVETPTSKLTGLTPLLLTAIGLGAGLLAGMMVWLLASHWRSGAAVAK